jgi:hypothetical protein
LLCGPSAAFMSSTPLPSYPKHPFFPCHVQAASVLTRHASTAKRGEHAAAACLSWTQHRGFPAQLLIRPGSTHHGEVLAWAFKGGCGYSGLSHRPKQWPSGVRELHDYCAVSRRTGAALRCGMLSELPPSNLLRRISYRDTQITSMATGTG